MGFVENVNLLIQKLPGAEASATQSSESATQSAESAAQSAESAAQSAESAAIAAAKANEIKSISAKAETLPAENPATVTYNPADNQLTFGIPQGVKGELGSSVESVDFVSTTDLSGFAAQSGATDTYRITFTDGAALEFSVYNGLDGGDVTVADLDTKVSKDSDTGSAYIPSGTTAQRSANPSIGSFRFNADLAQAEIWDGSVWKLLGNENISLLIHDLTEKTTPDDADELEIADSASSFLLKKLTWANLKATLKTYFDGLYATIANLNLKAPLANPALTGIPTAPTATTGTNTTQLATTAFVNKMAGGTAIPAVLKASNGYMKLANGVIIQWGVFSSLSDSSQTVTFPIAFVNACRAVTLSHSQRSEAITLAASNFIFTRSSSLSETFNVQYIAIGY